MLDFTADLSVFFSDFAEDGLYITTNKNIPIKYVFQEKFDNSFDDRIYYTILVKYNPELAIRRNDTILIKETEKPLIINKVKFFDELVIEIRASPEPTKWKQNCYLSCVICDRQIFTKLKTLK